MWHSQHPRHIEQLAFETFYFYESDHTTTANIFIFFRVTLLRLCALRMQQCPIVIFSLQVCLF